MENDTDTAPNHPKYVFDLTILSNNRLESDDLGTILRYLAQGLLYSALFLLYLAR